MIIARPSTSSASSDEALRPTVAAISAKPSWPVAP